jgi:foldase protein PrsA
LPKRSRVPPVIRPGSRKPTTRWDEERRSQLLVIALGASVVIVVAFIALFGYYQTKVRPKGETVLEVGSRSFSLDYVERRLRYDFSQGTGSVYQSDPTGAPTRLLNEIENEELMRQGAPEKGVDLSDEAIDAEIRTRHNAPASADRNTFAAAYRQAVLDSGLSTQGYRDVVAADIASKAIQPMFLAEAPKTADQVHFRAIIVTTEDAAKAALQRLQNGEDFAVVAQQVSEDTGSRDKGGDLDWFPRGVLESVLDQAVFSLEINQISDVIAGTNAYFIVQVLERQNQRDTTDSQRSTLASQAQQQWIKALSDRLGVATLMSDSQRASILSIVQSEIQKGQ